MQIALTPSKKWVSLLKAEAALIASSGRGDFDEFFLIGHVLQDNGSEGMI